MDKFKQEISGVCIFDKTGKRVTNKNFNSVYFISPKLNENVNMHKKLINSNALYISYGDFRRVELNGTEYISILNLGDKYIVSICLKEKINKDIIEKIGFFSAIIISDIIVIYKIDDIEKSMLELDVALDFGKEICAIPGDIFEYTSYLANYSIKQGAIPICNRYDINTLLKQKRF